MLRFRVLHSNKQDRSYYYVDDPEHPTRRGLYKSKARALDPRSRPDLRSSKSMLRDIRAGQGWISAWLDEDQFRRLDSLQAGPRVHLKPGDLDQLERELGPGIAQPTDPRPRSPRWSQPPPPRRGTSHASLPSKPRSATSREDARLIDSVLDDLI